MREMTGPVSWLEAGWQSLPSAEAPVGGTRANLFRRSKGCDRSSKPLTVAGPRRIFTGFRYCNGPLISLQLSHEAYHRPRSPRKSALRVWSLPSTLP